MGKKVGIISWSFLDGNVIQTLGVICGKWEANQMGNMLGSVSGWEKGPCQVIKLGDCKRDHLQITYTKKEKGNSDCSFCIILFVVLETQLL